MIRPNSVGAFLTVETLDPWHNMAVERVLFESSLFEGSAGPEGSGADCAHALLVWRNSPCVVIGRHQNPWVECDLAKMAAAAVPLLRRISGGGAVYHDPGNTNFTFFGTDTTYDLDRQFNVVIAALVSLGVQAWRNKRNDILVDDRKISGNAFRHTKGRSLHHGTLLVSADLDKLTAYLTSPPPATISSKGIPSVRSRVANLCEVREEVTHAAVVEALRDAYRAEYGGGFAARPDGPAILAAPQDHSAEQITTYERELRSWEWRFGKTPTFTRRVTVRLSGQPAATEIIVTVRHGRIETVVAAPNVGEGELPGVIRDAAGAVSIAVRAADDALRGTRFVREEIVAGGEALRGETMRTVVSAIGEAAGIL